MQTCQIKYHKEAEEKGIHIVSACGFDSVPADFGLEILREKFPGIVDSIWLSCFIFSTIVGDTSIS